MAEPTIARAINTGSHITLTGPVRQPFPFANEKMEAYVSDPSHRANKLQS